VSPALQVSVQLFAMQLCPVGQGLLQAPQFWLSELMFVH
jgi:hypothetical protein